MSNKIIQIKDSSDNALPINEVSGSSVNGSYVKFPDGTLICWGTLRNGASGAAYITFPVSFVDTNYTVVASILRSGADYINARIASIQIYSASQALIYLAQYNSTAAHTSTNTYSEWIAIGRWKA